MSVFEKLKSDKTLGNSNLVTADSGPAILTYDAFLVELFEESYRKVRDIAIGIALRERDEETRILV